MDHAAAQEWLDRYIAAWESYDPDAIAGLFSEDVVYRYQKAHRTVAHSVTIVWTARYRVGNGPWQDVPGSVTTTGPTTDLRIAEATPVLTSQR